MAILNQSTDDTMTRAKLLARLLQMQAAGENMALPVIVRALRKVPDKRKRNGTRTEEICATVRYACNGTVSIDGRDYGSLEGYAVSEFRS
jgi:hypothetical protein